MLWLTTVTVQSIQSCTWAHYQVKYVAQKFELSACTCTCCWGVKILCCQELFTGWTNISVTVPLVLLCVMLMSGCLEWSECKFMSLSVSCQHHIPHNSTNSISELFHRSWQKISIRSGGVGLLHAAGPDWSVHLLEKKKSLIILGFNLLKH